MTDSDHVEALIEALTQDVRRASFQDLERISAEIETIVPLLPDMNHAALSRIRAKAERCSACLSAAAQGLRAGHRRLAEISAADRSDTYDRSGARTPLPVQGAGRRL